MTEKCDQAASGSMEDSLQRAVYNLNKVSAGCNLKLSPVKWKQYYYMENIH